MAEFASTWKLGRARSEVVIHNPAASPGYGMTNLPLLWRSLDALFETASGQSYKRSRREGVPGSVGISGYAPLTIMEQLESLKYVTDTALSFTWSGGRNVLATRHTLATTTTLELVNTPMRQLGTLYKAAGGGETDIIVPTGVYAAYAADGAPGGTNYYNGGAAAYAAATGIVTLTSSPGAAGTVVYVNWTWSGWAVFLRDLRGDSVPGTSGFYRWSATLAPAL